MFETLTDAKFDDLRSALCGLHGSMVAFDERQCPALLSTIAALVRGENVSNARLAAIASSSQRPAARSGDGSVALLSVRGVAVYDLDYQPFCFSTRKLARDVQMLSADPSVSRIVLDIASPGGSVTGTVEAANAAFAARSRKPVTAIVNPLCASAAFWIASQASEIVAIPSADVGSIGVFVLHLDQSTMLAEIGIRPTFIFAGPNKTEANPLEPLSDEAKRFIQGEVDQVYSGFVGAVARGRGKSTQVVRSQFGGGRCLSAKAALAVGMIDRIEVADAAIQRSISPPAMRAETPSEEHQRRMRRLKLEALR